MVAFRQRGQAVEKAGAGRHYTPEEPRGGRRLLWLMLLVAETDIKRTRGLAASQAR